MQDSGFDSFSSRGSFIEREIITNNNLDIYWETKASDKHPQLNEDNMFVLQQRAAGVFDGVGSCDDAARASRIAANEIALKLKLCGNLDPSQIIKKIEQAFIEANNSVLQQARREGKRMSTTASVVYICRDSQGKTKAVVGNVGDSRVYLLKNGRLIQITLDDNVVCSSASNEEEARKLQAKLNNTINPKEELSEEEKELFNLRNTITQSLGQESVQPRMYTIELFPGDKILICSDGISDNLIDREIETILIESKDSEEGVDRLIKKAQERSISNHPRAKPDDMTAIVIGIGENQSTSNLPKQINVKIGDSVRVQRSNGSIEEGWVVSEIDFNSGMVTVNRRKGGRLLSKKVSISIIERLNRPATIQDIPYAEDFSQLFYILGQISGLQGSQRFFNNYELIERIREVITGKASLDTITRSSGLRDKVADLMRKQQKS